MHNAVVTFNSTHPSVVITQFISFTLYPARNFLRFTSNYVVATVERKKKSKSSSIKTFADNNKLFRVVITVIWQTTQVWNGLLMCSTLTKATFGVNKHQLSNKTQFKPDMFVTWRKYFYATLKTSFMSRQHFVNEPKMFCSLQGAWNLEAIPKKP